VSGPEWIPLAVGLGVAAVVAIVIALLVTSDSPGFYPDSSVYLGTARNLLDGRGLTTPFNLQFNPYPPAQAIGFHGDFPLTVYPPLGAAVAALPPDAVVASTFPSSLYTASGHDVVFVPPRWDRMSGEHNDRFHAQLVELGRLLAERKGYLALYPGPPKEFATTDELGRIMKAEVGTFADGTLYRVDGLQPGADEGVN
jgi:hypothetical protein